MTIYKYTLRKITQPLSILQKSLNRMYIRLYVNEMRRKFKEHVLPILPVVKKVLVITGRGSHSAGKESKLKKALFKLIGQYEEDIYFQRVDNNEGALYVLWRGEDKK